MNVTGVQTCALPICTNPVVRNDVNSFDVRIDHNFSERDQLFARVSYSDSPIFRPGPFSSYAEGGSFSQGAEHDTTTNDALSWTHSFSPSLIAENRFGFSRIASSRLQAYANQMGIPDQFGIPGIPQVPGNGGLPIIGIGGLSQMGGAAWLISREYNSTAQYTANLTKLYGGHTF